MRLRFEEEPEPDEPDEPDEPEIDAVAGPGPMVPAVSMGGREYEYRTELLTAAQVTDGKTLAEKLTTASADGWDLVEIVAAGDQYAVLQRKPKSPKKEARPVGFAPPGR
jgi:hypothetical protein